MQRNAAPHESIALALQFAVADQSAMRHPSLGKEFRTLDRRWTMLRQVSARSRQITIKRALGNSRASGCMASK